MGRTSMILAFYVLACSFEQGIAMGTYYWTYPDMSGSYVYPAAYQPFPAYPQILPVDCDQNKAEGGRSESSSSESSSSESSSSESAESAELKKEGEEASTEEVANTEGSEESSGTEENFTGEGTEEVAEIKEGGEESTEEGEPKGEGEPAEGGEKKEEGENKEGEEKKTKEKKPTSVFPPVTYTFPPRTVQQYIVSVPSNYPYRTYSLIQQQPVPVKSSGSYPYYSFSGMPVSSGYSAPIVKSVSSPPVARYVAKYVSPVTYSVSPSNGYQSNMYWSPNGNPGYFTKMGY